MRYSASVLLAIPLCALVFTLNKPAIAEDPASTISVTGTAEIRVVPDQVVLAAGVESRAKSVAAASADNDAKIREIVEFLKKSGIEEQHIHTEYISIEPIMRRPEQSFGKGNQAANAVNADPFSDLPESGEDTVAQPIGYMAGRQFAITIVDLRKFENIYKGLIERGINRVRGIEFRTTELRKHRDEARLQAVRAAKEKAQAIVGELDARLASIRTISESAAPVYAVQNSLSDPFGDAPSRTSEEFAVGQITIRAAVDIVFNLGDAEMEKN